MRVLVAARLKPAEFDTGDTPTHAVQCEVDPDTGRIDMDDRAVCRRAATADTYVGDIMARLDADPGSVRPEELIPFGSVPGAARCAFCARWANLGQDTPIPRVQIPVYQVQPPA